MAKVGFADVPGDESRDAEHATNVRGFAGLNGTDQWRPARGIGRLKVRPGGEKRLDGLGLMPCESPPGTRLEQRGIAGSVSLVHLLASLTEGFEGRQVPGHDRLHHRAASEAGLCLGILLDHPIQLEPSN